MLVFGHVGITTAAVKIFETAAFDNIDSTAYIDYRVVMLGSMLPDIIDKPLGEVLFKGLAHSGRSIAHTLLFSLILIIAGGILFLKYKSSIVLLLGACSAAHQILDWMFKYPETFFWPVFGDMFLAVPVSQGFSGEGGEAVRQGMTLLLGLKAYFFKPYIFIPEIIGITIMGWIFYRLAASREVIDFLRYGRL